MEVRRMMEKDLDECVEIIEDAKASLKARGINQWQEGYPNKESLVNDIEQNAGWVLEDQGKIIGMMALSFEGEASYQRIEGKWMGNESYGVIHRLAILSQYKGKKVADELLNHAIQKAKEKKIGFLRIDTHEKNQSMQNWIGRNQFQFCGIVTLSSGALRNAYEKKVG